MLVGMVDSMSHKAVFVDVDGTLVNEVGRVPETARLAVRQARSNGHLVFLSTGRSPIELWPEILDIGFDGLVAASGAYVEIGGEVLVHQHFSRSETVRVRDFFLDHGVAFYLQANDGVYATPQARSRLLQVIRTSVTDENMLAELEGAVLGFINSINVDADPSAAAITKAIFFDSALSLGEIRAEFAGTCDVTPSSVSLFGASSGEMTQAGVHKATGIDHVLRHLDLDLADTIALGDSYNDLEMLSHVAVGIAMGNAPQAVRDAADEMTSTPDEDGLQRAFLRHRLIGR